MTRKFHIVGLNGTLQSGKDTTAVDIKLIAEKAGWTVHHVSFANPLKDCMLPVFGGERRNYYGTNSDKDEVMEFWKERLGDNFATFRSAIQWIGTDLFREHVHPDFWIFATELRILNLLQVCPPTTLFVAADVRFNNEAKFILAQGGRVAHILRADGVKVKAAGIEGHRSEAGISQDLISDTYVCEMGDHEKAARDLLQKISLRDFLIPSP